MTRTMTTPRRLTLTEGGTPHRVSLSADEYQAVNALAVAVATPTVEPGVYDVTAGSKIGAVAVGDLQIVVRPKITDLNRLIFLLGYTRRPVWRDDHVQLTHADELFPALAEVFSRLASYATDVGLLQGYQTVTDTLPVLRGRVLATEQMTRRFGLLVPLAVEYDDFTVDIAENRLLLAATLRLLGVAGLSPEARRRLLRLRRLLGDVSAPVRGAPLDSWQPSRLNARYHDALRLAEIVLGAQSFEHRVGDLTVTGFMFDMWRIFEDFVCSALGEALGDRGLRTATQFVSHLDTDRQVTMKPDLVWLGERRRVLGVVDAKYKAERPDGFPNADLYQVLAYCTVFGLAEGHLVYAKGNEPTQTHHIRGAGIAVHCHTLDLSLPPAALLVQVRDLAARITTPTVQAGAHDSVGPT